MPYICVTGSTILQTIVQPDTSTHHVFQVFNNTELSFLTIRNAGPGYAGIASIDAGYFTQAHKISIINCDTGVLVTSITQDCTCYLEYLDINGSYSYGLQANSLNGYSLNINIENYYLIPGDTNTIIHNLIQGAGTQVNILTFGVIGYQDNAIAYSIINNALLQLVGGYIRDVYQSIVLDSNANVQVDACSLDSADTDIYMVATFSSLKFGNYICR